jgi:acyl dehydratase
MKMEIGNAHVETVTFPQEKVNAFAEVTGDKNPIHIDPEYAAKTPFKKPIVHGIFAMSVFSNILGMRFPGEGTVYLKQEISFKRPIFPDQDYEVSAVVKEINRERHTAILETKITDKETGKVNCVGEATIMHPTKI